MASVIDAPAVGNDLRRHGDGTVDIDLDRVLVARAQAGDGAAFVELYEHYHRRLFGVCVRRLGDRHEAEDVVQESFARAWRALPGLVGDRRFYPWLSVIASHLCTDILRRRGRSVPVADLQAGNVMSVEESGEDRVLAQCERAEVAAALGRLNERHRRVLALREQRQWSYQQIAETEGIAVSAVETLLWRARRALERCLAEAAQSGQLALVVGVWGIATLVRGLRRRAAGGVRAMGNRTSSLTAKVRHRADWCRTGLVCAMRRVAVVGCQWVGCPGPSGGQMAAFGAAAASVALSLALVGGGASSAPRAASGPNASRSAHESPLIGAQSPVASRAPTTASAGPSWARGLGARGLLDLPMPELSPSVARRGHGGASGVADDAAHGLVSGVGSATALLERGFGVVPGSWVVPSPSVGGAPGATAPPGAVPAGQGSSGSSSTGSVPTARPQAWTSGSTTSSEQTGAGRSAQALESSSTTGSDTEGRGAATSLVTMPGAASS